MMIDLEVCAASVQSAINAKMGGASRIELCQNLNEGGTTPSYATIDYCVNDLGLRTYVLVRPRAGGFTYSAEEHELIKRDVVMCRKIGAAAVVIGSLLPNGDVDMKQTRELVELAGDMEVTFHRAFDRCANWNRALEQVIDCGCSRILTSGCRPTASEGAEVLKELQVQVNGRIKLLAGSGINPKNVCQIIKSTGVSEVHASSKSVVPQQRYNDFFTSEGYAETNAAIVADIIHNIKAEGFTLR